MIGKEKLRVNMPESSKKYDSLFLKAILIRSLMVVFSLLLRVKRIFYLQVA